jgi:penicillin-binding protein-related factor A (putative recombinase)
MEALRLVLSVCKLQLKKKKKDLQVATQPQISLVTKRAYPVQIEQVLWLGKEKGVTIHEAHFQQKYPYTFCSKKFR